jgi:hypothetical protein
MSHALASLLSRFVAMKYFHGNMGTFKTGEVPRHNALGFFSWGRPLKIHIKKIKRELFEGDPWHSYLLINK